MTTWNRKTRHIRVITHAERILSGDVELSTGEIWDRIPLRTKGDAKGLALILRGRPDLFVQVGKVSFPAICGGQNKENLWRLK